MQFRKIGLMLVSLLICGAPAFANVGWGDWTDGGKQPTFYAGSPTGNHKVCLTNPTSSNRHSYLYDVKNPGGVDPQNIPQVPAGDCDSGLALRKFIDPLRVLSDPNTGTAKYIPRAQPLNWVRPDGTSSTDKYYEIAVVEFKERFHSDLPESGTVVRGYVQIDPCTTDNNGNLCSSVTPSGSSPDVNAHLSPHNSRGVKLYEIDGITAIKIPRPDGSGGFILRDAYGVDYPRYLGPIIEADQHIPSRVKFYNALPIGRADPTKYNQPNYPRNGDLFIPSDESLAGSGFGPDGRFKFSQNRAMIHLHGGDNPWISDGGPHQWITPARESGQFAVDGTYVMPWAPNTYINVGDKVVNNGRVFTATGSGLTNSVGPNVNAGGIGAINLTNAGAGYVTPPAITFTGGGGSGAAAVATLTPQPPNGTGSIAEIRITNPGSGYTSAPTINIPAPPAAVAPAVATNAAATVGIPFPTFSNGVEVCGSKTYTGGDANSLTLACHVAKLNTPGLPQINVNDYLRGQAANNVPDMDNPGPGAQTYYYPNGLSARTMWYHDHTFGLTRMNVYAGEASMYIVHDAVEKNDATLSALEQIPLVIQDKTFVPKDINRQDAKWDVSQWGDYGNLWYPHVYEVNQNPNSSDNTNPTGRWDWGPWFAPPTFAYYDRLPTGEHVIEGGSALAWAAMGNALTPTQQMIYATQTVSPTGLTEVTTTPEAYEDTPVVNGQAYPFLSVDAKGYKLNILNAANDRFINLGLYTAADRYSYSQQWPFSRPFNNSPVMCKGEVFDPALVSEFQHDQQYAYKGNYYLATADADASGLPRHKALSIGSITTGDSVSYQGLMYDVTATTLVEAMPESHPLSLSLSGNHLVGTINSSVFAGEGHPFVISSTGLLPPEITQGQVYFATNVSNPTPDSTTFTVSSNPSGSAVVVSSTPLQGSHSASISDIYANLSLVARGWNPLSPINKNETIYTRGNSYLVKDSSLGIASVTLTNNGSGYDANTSVTVDGCTIRQPSLVASVNPTYINGGGTAGGDITAINIVDPGAGCSANPTIHISGSGSNASAVAQVAASSGIAPPSMSVATQDMTLSMGNPGSNNGSGTYLILEPNISSSDEFIPDGTSVVFQDPVIASIPQVSTSGLLLIQTNQIPQGVNAGDIYSISSDRYGRYELKDSLGKYVHTSTSSGNYTGVVYETNGSLTLVPNGKFVTADHPAKLKFLASAQDCTEAFLVPSADTQFIVPDTGGLEGTGWGDTSAQSLFKMPTPHPNYLGPDINMIANEGGVLPTLVTIPSTPLNWETNNKNAVFLNVKEKGLFLGPALRANVVVDFANFAGQTLILYNDAAAPLPAIDQRLAYYTGNGDMTSSGGGEDIPPGYGPNIRTLMQIRVGDNPTTPISTSALVATVANLNRNQAKAVVPANTAGTYKTGTMTTVIPNSGGQMGFTGLNFRSNAYKNWGDVVQVGDIVNGPAGDTGSQAGAAIASITYSTTTATITTVSAHGLSSGNIVAVTGVSPAAYNVPNASITVTSPTTFTYVMGSNPGASGGNLVGALITTMTNTTNVATVTTATVHGLRVGNTITVIGATPAAYNGTFVVASVPTTTSFTYTMLSDPGVGASASVVGSYTTIMGSYTLTNGQNAYTVVVAPMHHSTGSAIDWSSDRVTCNLSGFCIVNNNPSNPMVLAKGALKFKPAPTCSTTVAANATVTCNTNLPTDVMSNAPQVADPEGKSIFEAFDLTWGRMNAQLGITIPGNGANILANNVIPLGYIDAPTENINDGAIYFYMIDHIGVDSHPVHFHLFDVQVLNRVGIDGMSHPIVADEAGWKETVVFNPLTTGYVALRPRQPALPFGLPMSVRSNDPSQPIGGTNGFSLINPITALAVTTLTTNAVQNYMWEYTWHCHILGHEENDFMRPIVFNPGPIVAPATPSLGAAGNYITNSGKVEWTDASSRDAVDTLYNAYSNEIGYTLNRISSDTTRVKSKTFAIPANLSYIVDPDYSVLSGVGSSPWATYDVPYFNGSTTISGVELKYWYSVQAYNSVAAKSAAAVGYRVVKVPPTGTTPGSVPVTITSVVSTATDITVSFQSRSKIADGYKVYATQVGVAGLQIPLTCSNTSPTTKTGEPVVTSAGVGLCTINILNSPLLPGAGIFYLIGVKTYATDDVAGVDKYGLDTQNNTQISVPISNATGLNVVNVAATYATGSIVWVNPTLAAGGGTGVVTRFCTGGAACAGLTNVGTQTATSAPLTGLTANTTYYYDVKVGKSPVTTSSFTTAPAPQSGVTSVVSCATTNLCTVTLRVPNVNATGGLTSAISVSRAAIAGTPAVALTIPAAQAGVTNGTVTATSARAVLTSAAGNLTVIDTNVPANTAVTYTFTTTGTPGSTAVAVVTGVRSGWTNIPSISATYLTDTKSTIVTPVATPTAYVSGTTVGATLAWTGGGAATVTKFCKVATATATCTVVDAGITGVTGNLNSGNVVGGLLPNYNYYYELRDSKLSPVTGRLVTYPAPLTLASNNFTCASATSCSMAFTLNNPNGAGAITSTASLTRTNTNASGVGTAKVSAATTATTLTVPADTFNTAYLGAASDYLPYVYTMTATAGAKATTTTLSLNTPALVVTNPTRTAATATTATAQLSWTGPGTISAFCPATANSVVPITCPRAAGAPFAQSATGQNVTGLASNTLYYYQVRNKDGVPTDGWLYTNPAPITSLTGTIKAGCTAANQLTVGNCTRTLNWVNPNPGASTTTVINVTRTGGTGAAPVTPMAVGAANTLTDEPLISTGATYVFSVTGNGPGGPGTGVKSSTVSIVK